jgi:hypothetical protein
MRIVLFGYLKSLLSSRDLRPLLITFTIVLCLSLVTLCRIYVHVIKTTPLVANVDVLHL